MKTKNFIITLLMTLTTTYSFAQEEIIQEVVQEEVVIADILEDQIQVEVQEAAQEIIQEEIQEEMQEQPQDLLAKGEKIKLKNAGKVEKYEVPCLFNLSNEMTEEELDRYKAQKCYSLRMIDATVEDENGEEKKLEKLELSGMMNKMTSSMVKESEACVDLYAQGLNDLFEYGGEDMDLTKGQTLKYPDGRELSLKIPASFEVFASVDNTAVAHSDFNTARLGSRIGIFDRLAQVSNNVVNTATQKGNFRQGFSLSFKDGEDDRLKKQCWSVSKSDDIQIAEDKYNTGTPENAIQDVSRLGGNLLKRTVQGFSRMVNNTSATISQ